jgi:hypothetical protein
VSGGKLSIALPVPHCKPHRLKVDISLLPFLAWFPDEPSITEILNGVEFSQKSAVGGRSRRDMLRAFLIWQGLPEEKDDIAVQRTKELENIL